MQGLCWNVFSIVGMKKIKFSRVSSGSGTYVDKSSNNWIICTYAIHDTEILMCLKRNEFYVISKAKMW